jgi:hypothetical protein
LKRAWVVSKGAGDGTPGLVGVCVITEVALLSMMIHRNVCQLMELQS